MRSSTRRYVVGALLVFLLGLAGHFEKRDRDEEQARYCKMVKSGAWPDYRESYAAECGSVETPN